MPEHRAGYDSSIKSKGEEEGEKQMSCYGKDVRKKTMQVREEKRQEEESTTKGIGYSSQE